MSKLKELSEKVNQELSELKKQQDLLGEQLNKIDDEREMLLSKVEDTPEYKQLNEDRRSLTLLYQSLYKKKHKLEDIQRALLNYSEE